MSAEGPQPRLPAGLARKPGPYSPFPPFPPPPALPRARPVNCPRGRDAVGLEVAESLQSRADISSHHSPAVTVTHRDAKRQGDDAGHSETMPVSGPHAGPPDAPRGLLVALNDRR